VACIFLTTVNPVKTCRAMIVGNYYHNQSFETISVVQDILAKPANQTGV